jgi:hypothetical protein
MARTVVALYDDFDDASAAVRELVDHGFSRDSISFMAADRNREYGQALEEQGIDETSGAGVGAGIGAVLGGLAGVLIGLGALVVPGIGPVIAAGPLSTVLAGLAGAGAGAVAGGVLGALVDMGVPEETAGYFAEGIRRGGTLVTVQSEDTRTDQAVDILNRHDPVDINDRVGRWRDEGWTGFRHEAGEDYSTDTGIGEETYRTGSSMGEETYRTGSGMGTQGYRSDMGMDYGDDYDRYDTGFRTHFNSSSYAGTYEYEEYRPAYRYGYLLGTDPNYRNREWTDIEPEARRHWDEEHQVGTWDRFKDSVRHAWEEIKESVS